MERDIIFLTGAPGSGKTTVSKLLREKLRFPPLIELGRIVYFHLNKNHKNQTKEEEQISFENLSHLIKNYIDHNYKNIIVVDLQDFRTKQISKIFSDKNYVILTLILKDEIELKKRVISPRNTGFRDFKKAILWNKHLQERKLLKNEFLIDNTEDIEKTIEQIMDILHTRSS